MEQIKPILQAPVDPANNSLASAVPPQQVVVKKLPSDNNTKMKLILVGIAVVIAGIGTGYTLSGAMASTGEPAPTSNISEKTNEGQVDESIFSDTAIGMLHEGGLKGEGTHYLDTGLGEEKYVYLLSTVIDLQSFVGKKVEVNGQTLAAESAGWLMDVGRVKVLE